MSGRPVDPASLGPASSGPASPGPASSGALFDPFYPVVSSAAWVRRLVGAGARLVQLRIKDAAPVALAREIRLARDLCAAAGATLVLNDHWRAAIDEGVAVLHLGQEDLDGADLAAIRRAGLLLGISTHSEDELERALAVRPDYVALGPIYPTTLKQMPWAPHGPERLRAWKRRIGGLHLVAIGGITLERAPACLRAGADVVAVVSDVLAHAQPEERARAWMAATR